MVRFSKLIEKDRTKNKASHRTYPLIPEVKTILKKIKVQQAENRLLMGSDYHVSDYVFTWPDGRSLTPDYVSCKFAQVIDKNELRHIRFHDLRHTFATHALTSGVDAKTLSGILGHTNASFTLDTYTHVTKDMQKQAANVVGGFMEDILGKGASTWQKSEKPVMERSG